jgi:hypothetical protein
MVDQPMTISTSRRCRAASLRVGDELLDEAQAERRDRAEHRIAQRRADAGQIARRRRRP